MSLPRVAVDYWPATTHAPGVGRYVRELVRALVRLEDVPALELFDVGPGERVFDGEALGLERAPPRVRRTSAPLPRRALGALSRIGIGPERIVGGCALFHAAFAGDPRVRVPRVVPLSSLPPEGSDEERDLAARVGEGTATDLVVFSRVAGELAEARLCVESERVHVLPVGAEHWARELPCRPDGATEVPHLVALGRIEPARRPLSVLNAFERLRERGERLRLVFVGRRGSSAAELERSLAASRFRADVEWIASPVEADMPRLVGRAAAVVHMATDELTPVTPLEALALGVPVVATRLPAFEEALGDAAFWVEGGGVDELEGRVAEALAASRSPARAAARRATAEPFTWERHARLTLGLWRRILAR